MQNYKTFTAQISHFWAAMRLSDYDELINEIWPCKSEFPISGFPQRQVSLKISLQSLAKIGNF